jgi:hypothetical protein
MALVALQQLPDSAHWYVAFFFGAIGAGMAEVISLYDLYRQEKKPRLPPWARARTYRWLAFFVIIGGGFLPMTYVLSNIYLTAFLAWNVGAAATVGVRALAQGFPGINPGPVK